MRISLALVAALALGTTACSSLELNTDYNPGTDFSKYKSFSIKEGAKPRNPVAARSVGYAIELTLEAKGLKNVEEGADLFVYGHFVLDQELRVEAYGYASTGWYGYGYGGVTTARVRTIPVGTLVIDLVDSGTKSLVWRGIVKDEISKDLYPEEREQKAIRIAQDLFADFPPKPKK
jgi:hypothetical protein